MKARGILSGFRDRFALRRRIEGYGLSILFHILLLLLLATITISTGGDGFGLGGAPPGAKVSLVTREDAVEEAELEDMIEDVEVKPLEVQRVEQRAVRLPELTSFSVPRPSSQRLANIDSRFSPATGGVGGLSGQFGSFIGGLRKTGLDVAIVIDATNSMQDVIDDIKAKASALVGDIQRLVPIARVGVVAFRDKGDEFLVRWSDLSFHARKTQAFLDGLKAAGGGDYEEAVREGLEAAMDDLSWRKRAKRVIIVVGGSPPHRHDIEAIKALAREFRGDGGVISTIDVTRRLHEEYQRKLSLFLHGKATAGSGEMPDFYNQVRDDYRMIADIGGGELASLGTSNALTEQILFFAFGSRWRKEIERYTSSK